MARSGYYKVDGFVPPGASGDHYWISIVQLQKLQRYGPSWKFYAVRTVAEILANPLVIFSGLKREGFDDGFVIAGIPAVKWQSDTIQVPSPPGLTFVVSTREDLTVLDWEWRKSSNDSRRGFPQNWEEDFEEILWQKN